MCLVKIRNPWNEGEWKGKWCDGSQEWYDELRIRLNHEDKADGLFWI